MDGALLIDHVMSPGGEASDTLMFGDGFGGHGGGFAAAGERLIGDHAKAKQQVEIELPGDGGDTRNHALAVGARRAEEVRGYLILLGVPAAQVSATSWGKERPGPPRAITVLVQ